MPCSSPRSSGCRATDWIIEPKMLPMPTPAPSEPRPMPSASAIALPASTLPELEAASRKAVIWCRSSLVFWLDRRADVDGRQGGEDERLDRDDDDDLEEVEDGRSRHGDHGQHQRLEHEDQPDEGQDQHVAREHVGEETDAERDQAHELAEDLERDDQRQDHPRNLGNPALEVADRAVPADALVMREEERQQRERERDGER